MPQSILSRYEPFIAAALLTAHGINQKHGFRQVEVRWYIELFANWMELIEEQAGFSVQNTQTARYIETLAAEGYARQVSAGKYPLYRLTRPGLFEVVSRLVRRAYFPRREHFFFVYFFVRSYRQRLIKMVQAEGTRFPYPMQAELNSLLDADLLLADQIAHVRRDLEKLDKRLAEQQKTLALAQQRFQSGRSYKDVLRELDRRYPFSLDPQRRYSELYAKGTEKQHAWELTKGTANRLRDLWLPSRRMLQHYLDELELLKSGQEPALTIPLPVEW